MFEAVAGIFINHPFRAVAVGLFFGTLGIAAHATHRGRIYFPVFAGAAWLAYAAWESRFTGHELRLDLLAIYPGLALVSIVGLVPWIPWPARRIHPAVDYVLCPHCRFENWHGYGRCRKCGHALEGEKP